MLDILAMMFICMKLATICLAGAFELILESIKKLNLLGIRETSKVNSSDLNCYLHLALG